MECTLTLAGFRALKSQRSLLPPSGSLHYFATSCSVFFRDCKRDIEDFSVTYSRDESCSPSQFRNIRVCLLTGFHLSFVREVLLSFSRLLH